MSSGKTCSVFNCFNSSNNISSWKKKQCEIHKIPQGSPLGHVVILRKKAADTGSLLTHFICLSFRSIIYEANGEELYNSRVERLLAEYLIDTLPGVSGSSCLCALDSILAGVASMTRGVL